MLLFALIGTWLLNNKQVLCKLRDIYFAYIKVKQLLIACAEILLSV